MPIGMEEEWAIWWEWVSNYTGWSNWDDTLKRERIAGLKRWKAMEAKGEA